MSTNYDPANARTVDGRLDAAAFDALFEHAPVGLALLDSDKRYVRINGPLAGMNGVPASDHIGRTPSEVIPHGGGVVESVLDHVLASKVPMRDVELNATIPANPSEPASFKLSLIPLIEDGLAIGILGVVEGPPST
ncbi:MAG: hypothetical protein QOG54_765 [Actinomycetota bacterium]|jgi:PAS domain-containing protein|nr:hypothetical protein [Actinomycetota bacterium]